MECSLQCTLPPSPRSWCSMLVLSGWAARCQDAGHPSYSRAFSPGTIMGTALVIIYVNNSVCRDAKLGTIAHTLLPSAGHQRTPDPAVSGAAPDPGPGPVCGYPAVLMMWRVVAAPHRSATQTAIRLALGSTSRRHLLLPCLLQPPSSHPSQLTAFQFKVMIERFPRQPGLPRIGDAATRLRGPDVRI